MKIKSKIINANAGSGKTYKIIERIAEIIKAGHSPSSILCITFTKAGATEMKDRLEEKFPDLIQKQKPKISTFHALCQEIVSMFSYELQMPYQFENMERVEESFLEKIISKVLDLEEVKNLILKFDLSYGEITSICKALLFEFYNISQSEGTRQKSLTEIFNITKEIETEKNGIYFEVLNNVPLEILKNIKGKAANENLPAIFNLLQSDAKSSIQEKFEQYIDLVRKIRSKEIAEYKEMLNVQIERIKTINHFEISKALNNCFPQIAQIIEKEKHSQGKYLFEDMVQKALFVLKSPELKDFALFKFGSQYKHFLIDEAQDTNQDQWQIIDCLAEENMATNIEDGSLFIVGDVKQTIYGFQGAEAGIMNDVHLKYKHILHEEYLTTSYRTTKPVLDVINAAFAIEEKQSHISNFNDVGVVKVVKSSLKPEKEEKDLEIQKIAQFVANEVKHLLTQTLHHTKHAGNQIQHNDIAILSKQRDAKTIAALREAFFQHSIQIVFNEKINYKN